MTTSYEDAAADSATLTLGCTDIAPQTATRTAVRYGSLCLALGGALFLGGGLTYTQYSPSAVGPIIIRSAASSAIGLVNAPVGRTGEHGDKKAQLLKLIGSWQGDDFEDCLSAVYETRSIVEHGDVPA